MSSYAGSKNPSLVCPVESLQSSLSRRLQEDVFQNTRAIVKGHDFGRFGHSNNATALYSDNAAVRKEYIMGLASASIILFVFFLSWLIVIIIFKCLGRKSVGFFSGHRVTLPREPLPPAPDADFDDDGQMLPQRYDNHAPNQGKPDYDGNFSEAMGPYPGLKRKPEEVPQSNGNNRDSVSDDRFDNPPDDRGDFSQAMGPYPGQAGSRGYDEEPEQVPHSNSNNRGVNDDKYDNPPDYHGDFSQAMGSYPGEVGREQPPSSTDMIVNQPKYGLQNNDDLMEHDDYQSRQRDDRRGRVDNSKRYDDDDPAYRSDPDYSNNSYYGNDPYKYQSEYDDDVYANPHHNNERDMLNTEGQPVYSADGVRISRGYDLNKTPEQYEKDMVAYRRIVRARKRRITIIRCLVLLCCVATFISALLILFKGLRSLTSAIHDGEAALSAGINRTEEAMDLINNFGERQSSVINQARSAANTLNSICPLVRPKVCQDLLTGEGCDYADMPAASQVEYFVAIMKEFFTLNLDVVESELENAKQQLETIQLKVDNYRWVFIVAAVFTILLEFISLVLVIGICVSWSRDNTVVAGKSVMSCLQGCCILPLFVFLVLVCWLFSMIFVAGALGADDACYNSPDNFVASILTSQVSEDTQPSVESLAVIPYAVWIVNGCPAGVEPISLPNLLNGTLEAAYAVDTLAQGIASTAVDISQRCQIDPNSVYTAASLLSGELCLFALTLFDTAQFFTCENWRPIYTMVAYNAACYEGASGIAWMVLTQIIIVFCAMIILTLRTAFYEIGEDIEGI